MSTESGSASGRTVSRAPRAPARARLNRAGAHVADDDRRPEIDGLRAVAVLVVVASHAADYAATANFGFVAHAGSRGIDLFFVLSGFCLSYPVLQARNAAAVPRILPFLRRRLARIAPPYYVAIALFAVLGFTGFGLPTYPLAAPSHALQLRDAGFDALFLTSAFPMHNADFWTLGLEMRWYVLFPLVLAAFVRSKLLFAALGLGAYALYATPYGIADLGTLPCFMLGIVAAELRVRRARVCAYAWIAALPTLAFACYAQLRSPAVDHGDYTWHVAAFSLVVAVTGSSLLARAFANRALVALGVASYSIYLVHHPLLQGFAEAGMPLLPASLASIVLGLVFWKFVEEPLARREVRVRVEDALRLRLPRTAAPRATVVP